MKIKINIKSLLLFWVFYGKAYFLKLDRAQKDGTFPPEMSLKNI